MTLLFWLFISSWGQWICAFAPSFTVISNVLPFFFVMFSLFNGVVRPYSMLPVFWRYWMYYVFVIPPVGVEKIADDLQKSFDLLDWWCPRGNT